MMCEIDEFDEYGPVDLTALLCPSWRCRTVERVITFAPQSGEIRFPGGAVLPLPRITLKCSTEWIIHEPIKLGQPDPTRKVQQQKGLSNWSGDARNPCAAMSEANSLRAGEAGQLWIVLSQGMHNCGDVAAEQVTVTVDGVSKSCDVWLDFRGDRGLALPEEVVPVSLETKGG